MSDIDGLKKTHNASKQHSGIIENLAMIACVSQDYGLGKDNDLLWRIPADQKFFRETTTGSAVIMGRKTFESIGRALPRRQNIVLSRHAGDSAAVEWVSSPEELEQKLAEISGPKFIIGGASLYQSFLDRVDTLYLTAVDAVKPADTFFPKFDQRAWNQVVLGSGDFEGTSYRFIKYTRKK